MSATTHDNQCDSGEHSKLVVIADELAAAIAKGSSDYGARRNLLKRLLMDFAKEVRRNEHRSA